MGNPGHYVIEAEFFMNERGSNRQTIQEQVSRWLTPPEPLACIRFFDHEGAVRRAVARCVAAEERRDTARRLLLEQTFSEEGEHADSQKVLKEFAKMLAGYGDEARTRRAQVMTVLGDMLEKAVSKPCDILIRNHRNFLPLESVGVLYLAQAFEDVTAYVLTVRRGKNLFELEGQPELALF